MFISENSILVEFEITPLGEVKVIWSIPSEFLFNRNEFLIEVPGFKYDLPTFASIPVPFSSKGTQLQIHSIKYPKSYMNCKIKKGMYSNRLLKFGITNEVSNEITKISYSIPNLVNNDGIYFVTVYPFRSPFDSIKHLIKIRAKFSYNIRKYKFWERHFAFPSNEKLEIKPVFKHEKKGDEILLKGFYWPKYERTFDLHLTATRFPIFIRRDYFWFTVFIAFLIVALSPYLVEVIKFLIGYAF